MSPFPPPIYTHPGVLRRLDRGTSTPPHRAKPRPGGADIKMEDPPSAQQLRTTSPCKQATQLGTSSRPPRPSTPFLFYPVPAVVVGCRPEQCDGRPVTLGASSGPFLHPPPASLPADGQTDRRTERRDQAQGKLSAWQEVGREGRTSWSQTRLSFWRSSSLRRRKRRNYFGFYVVVVVVIVFFFKGKK